MIAHRTLGLAALVIGLGSLVGCSSEGDASSADSNLTDEKMPTAGAKKEPTSTAGAKSVKVTTKKVTLSSATCTGKADVPVVDAGDKAVTDALTKELAAHSSEVHCKEMGGGQIKVTVTTTYVVAANERGILSLVITHDSMNEGGIHPNVEQHGLTFDLKTGKRLALADFLDATGIEATISSCTESFAKQTARPGEDAQESHEASRSFCEMGIAPTNKYGFSIDKDGLEVLLDVPHVIAVAGAQNVAWSSLKSGLEPGLVADWVAGK